MTSKANDEPKADDELQKDGVAVLKDEDLDAVTGGANFIVKLTHRDRSTGSQPTLVSNGQHKNPALNKKGF